MPFQLPTDASESPRGDTPAPVVVFDMFGTIHQVPGARSAARAEATGEAGVEAPVALWARRFRGWRAGVAVLGLGLAAAGFARTRSRRRRS